MDKLSTLLVCDAGYILRFVDLFNRGRGYAFPCDADGRVAVAAMSARGRDSYEHAVDAVGREFSLPVVACALPALRRRS